MEQIINAEASCSAEPNSKLYMETTTTSDHEVITRVPPAEDLQKNYEEEIDKAEASSVLLQLAKEGVHNIRESDNGSSDNVSKSSMDQVPSVANETVLCLQDTSSNMAVGTGSFVLASIEETPVLLEPVSYLKIARKGGLSVNEQSVSNTNEVNIVSESPTGQVSETFFVPVSGPIYVQQSNIKEEVILQSHDQQLQLSVASAQNVPVTIQEKKIQCNLCQATFTRPSNYTRHKLTHKANQNDFRYKCEVCDRTFLQKCDLKRHMHIHNNTYPYKCSICSKGFIRHSDMKVHVNFHTGHRPFKCSFCDKKFYQSGDQKRHERTVHLRQKQALCIECGNKFSSETTLMRHMQSVHKTVLLDSIKADDTLAISVKLEDMEETTDCGESTDTGANSCESPKLDNNISKSSTESQLSAISTEMTNSVANWERQNVTIITNKNK